MNGREGFLLGINWSHVNRDIRFRSTRWLVDVSPRRFAEFTAAAAAAAAAAATAAAATAATAVAGTDCRC